LRFPSTFGAGNLFPYLAKSGELMPTILTEELIDRHIAIHLRNFHLNYNLIADDSQTFNERNVSPLLGTVSRLFPQFPRGPIPLGNSGQRLFPSLKG
jgi:hypothetical protein